MPAQAGIQKLRRNSLDFRFRGNDVGGLQPEQFIRKGISLSRFGQRLSRPEKW